MWNGFGADVLIVICASLIGAKILQSALRRNDADTKLDIW